MGKQKKRRSNNKKSGKASKAGAAGATNSAASIPKSKSNVVNRIRHGDLRVRHGALTALSATLFSPSSLSKSAKGGNTNTNMISMELIQAMSERIMDDDVPIAMCALGCMGNYILFRPLDNVSGTKVETMLTPILLQKMNGACDAIESIAKDMTALEHKVKMSADANSDANANSNSAPAAPTIAAATEAPASTNNKKKKSKKQNNGNNKNDNHDPMHKKTLAFMEQWAVQSLCLHALCGMVEGTTTANHESSSVLHHLKQDFLSTVLRSFLLATECITGLGISLAQNENENAKDGSIMSGAAAGSDYNNNISNSKGTMKQWIATKENESNTIADVVTYAARTIHSSCDDNPTFLSSLWNTPSSNSSMSSSSSLLDGWKTIVSSITNTSLPTLTRIHCSGIVILARQAQSAGMGRPATIISSPSSSATTTTTTPPSLSELTDIVTTQALPLLSTCTMYNPSIASALYNRISITHAHLMKEREDEAMEANVIRAVTERKESARLIARRQKMMKEDRKRQKLEEREKEKEQEKNDDSAMDEDKDDNQDKGKGENANVEREGGGSGGDDGNNNDGDSNKNLDILEDQYDKAVNAWKSACLPLKLSVEVIANLCVSETDDYDDGDVGGNYPDDGDDDMAWDSDEEERLMLEQKAMGMGMGAVTSKEEVAFRNQVVSSGVADRVLAVFGTILLSLMNGTTCSGEGGKNAVGADGAPTNRHPTIHPLAMEDLMEVLGKCSICLGNAACNLQTWKCDEKDLSSMWNEFMQCLRAAAAATNDDNESGNGITADGAQTTTTIPNVATAAILSCMGAFLRFRRPILVKCVNEQDLDLILSFVLMESSSSSSMSLDDDNVEEAEKATVVADIQKDAIGMLGILCSEPHPDPINEKICSAFLTSLQRHLTTTTGVMSEVLNALMDMYSADDDDPNNHEKVFRAKNVLGAFQKTVPIFKRKIREDERRRNSSTSISRGGMIMVCSLEEMEVWKETALNAVRFIKYKKGN